MIIHFYLNIIIIACIQIFKHSSDYHVSESTNIKFLVCNIDLRLLILKSGPIWWKTYIFNIYELMAQMPPVMVLWMSFMRWSTHQNAIKTRPLPLTSPCNYHSPLKPCPDAFVIEGYAQIWPDALLHNKICTLTISFQEINYIFDNLNVPLVISIVGVDSPSLKWNCTEP